MVKGTTESAGVIFTKIDLLFMEQVGPIASIIAQEELNKWLSDLSSSGQKASLRNISGYVERLADQILNPDDRTVFINSVYEINALTPYKSHYKGAL